MRTVEIHKESGFCFGVVNAIQSAEKEFWKNLDNQSGVTQQTHGRASRESMVSFPNGVKHIFSLQPLHQFCGKLVILQSPRRRYQ